MSMSATMSSAAADHPLNGLGGYLSSVGRHDEFKDAQGNIRPGWQKLAATLGNLPPGELARRSEQLRRLIEENGITYNVYSDTGGGARPWTMDLLPMLLEYAEWVKLEAALGQRARLINLILQDLYGPQRLLEQKVLPPALVLGNPAFLRPCHGYTPPDGQFVPVYCADLGRAQNGQWWVLAERLDAPSGIGYALENRALTMRVFPDWLRDNRVARLSGFSQTLRESIAHLAANQTESPHMAFWTPGPANETYFEHSFLARNLGFSLVEGGDLMARGQKVFLKTLSGLRPVDLLFRRVDSAFCDPLELRSDSLLGVPGLLQAVRGGGVTMANALGAGLLEAPGLSPFFPALCRHLLGEELKMPSVAMWWCGQPRELAYVVEHLEELILQPAFSLSPRDLVAGPRLSKDELAYWRTRLRAEPEAWCAHEWVSLATTPVYENGNVVPRLFQMRSLVVAHGGGYHALPGGLTRIPTEDDDFTVSMQSGGRSKDTWVLLPPELPTAVDISLAQNPPIKLRRPAPDLPSRVADNLFWLGRYLERTENQAHLLRLLAGALAEEGAATDPEAIRPFFETLRLADSTYLLVPGKPTALNLAAAEQDLHELLWDASQPNSLAANIARMERTAYRVKERLPGDVWNLLGRLRQNKEAPHDPTAFLPQAFAQLQDALAQLAAVSGFLTDSMIRGYGWRFLDLGRRIERGLNVGDLLRRTLGRTGVPPPALLHNLLVGCECLLIYRRRYLTNLQAVPVLDLLTCDENNPHGLAFQLQRIQHHIADLPREPGREPTARPVERLALALSTKVGLADAYTLAQDDGFGGHKILTQFLDDMTRELTALSDALGLEYFAHGGRETSP